MNIKLLNPSKNGICVKEMQDGDIAEILQWGGQDKIGKIVQRYEDFFILIGKSSGHSYTTLMQCSDLDSFRVRILNKGETLVIGE